MLAGGIPGVCIILYDLTGPYGNSISFSSPLFLYVMVPAFVAAIFGFFVGADILNPDKVLRAREAAALGFAVSWAAWGVLVPIVCLTMKGGPENYIVTFFLYKLALVFLGGSIIFGWGIAAVGTVTGLLLYRFRKSLGQV